MRTLPLLFLGAALLAPLTASAQEVLIEVPALLQGQRPAAPTKNQNLPVSVKEKTTKQAREALEKTKIDLELRNAEPEQAFQQLIKQIGVDYDIDTAFYPFGGTEMDLPERALNMKLTKASAARALDSFCQALGIGWWAEKVDDTVMVHIVKLQGTMGKMDMLASLGVNVPAITAQAIHATDLSMVFGGVGGGLLPDKRVKIDATSPRDVKTLIEDLCKQAGLVFAIDSDVANTSKALVFENVPIKTALETLCATANLSMSISKKGEKTIVTFSTAEGDKE